VKLIPAGSGRSSKWAQLRPILSVQARYLVMYIDPSSGGMLFQALLVIFGVFSGVVLIFSSRIKMGIARLRRLMRHEDESQELADEDLDPE